MVIAYFSGKVPLHVKCLAGQRLSMDVVSDHARSRSASVAADGEGGSARADT
jgi:hypothetical protein